jgi:hypothetical protein
MKLLIILLILLPFSGIGQTTADYNFAMAKFQKFYNAAQGDSINAMCGHSWGEAKAYKPLWTNDETAKLLDDLGTLLSFKFIGIDKSDPQKVYVFQTIFSKAGQKTTSCTLDKENALLTFRLVTNSSGIEKLVRKAKKVSK